tara:strand:+ start:1856 stop:2044 length:189 start_codon:yes stop_codon:yes gene_type:complete
MAKYAARLPMRDVRNIFQHLRLGKERLGDEGFENVLLPRYGLTAGEFSTFYILNGNKKKAKK